MRMKGDIINNYTGTTGINQDCYWAKQINVILATRNKTGKKRIRKKMGLGGTKHWNEGAKLTKRKGRREMGKAEYEEEIV